MTDINRNNDISNIFESNAKILAGLFIGLALLGLVAGMIGPWVIHQIKIDKCLDKGEPLRTCSRS